MYSRITLPSTLRVTIALAICGALLASSNVSLLVSEAQNAGQSRQGKPRPGKPEGSLPNLEDVQNESTLEREPTAPIPSTIRSPKVSLNPWNGRTRHEIQSKPTGNQVSAREDAARQKVAGQSVTPLQQDACLSGFPNLKRAWDMFTHDGKWRMARRNDFRLSQTILEEDGGIPKFVDKPCVLGQLRGPDARTEFAAIVISDQLPEPERFGVIVFNGLEEANVVPDAHWLMQQVDLSRSKIYTRKRRLFVGRYNDDRWVGSCGAYWDEANRKYSCVEVSESNP